MAEWMPVLVAQAWQVTLLIVVVAAINRWTGKSRPHLAHALWLVVLVKCVTPPVWSSPSGLFCWLQPARETNREPLAVLPASRSWNDLVASARHSQSVDVVHRDAGLVESDVEPEESLLGFGEFGNPVPDVPSTITSDKVNWPRLLLGAWAIASLVVITVAVVRWLRCWRMLRNAPQRECSELSSQLDLLAKQLGLRHRVRLIVTESRLGPAVIGLFRTTVLLPALIVDRLAQRSPVAPRQESRTSLDSHSPREFASQLRDGSPVAERQGYVRQDYGSLTPILTHELLHIRRGDLWVGLLQTLAQAVWWCHPLVWWVNRRTTREAERCCDEEVLAELGCDPAAYARALVDVLELKRELKPVPVFPGVRPVEVTTQRLERIMQLGQGCQRRTPWWCWLIAGLAAAATWPGAAFVVTAEGPKETGERGGVSPPVNSPATQNRGADATPLADSISLPTIEPRVVHGVGVNSDAGVTGQIVDEKIGEAPAGLPHPLPIVAPAKRSDRQILLQFHVYEVDEEGLKELGIKLGRAKTTWDGTKTRTVAQFQADQDVFAKLAEMVREKRVKVLSSPTIQTLDGHTANFLCGGEFPVPAVVGIGDAKGTAVSLRGFGLQLTTTPTIVGPDSLRVSFTWSDSKVANEQPSGATAVAPTLILQSIQSELLVKPKQPVIVGPLGEPGAKGKQRIATLVAEIVDPEHAARQHAHPSLSLTAAEDRRSGNREDGAKTQAGSDLPAEVGTVTSSQPAPTIVRREKLVSVNAKNVTLKELIQRLALLSGHNIVLDKAGLEDEGLDEDVLVSMSVEQLKLSSVLTLMLDPLNLDYRVDESGAIVVTSKQRLKRKPVVVTYAVGDLTPLIPRRVTVNLTADQAVTQAWSDGEPVTPMKQQLRDVADLISSTCQPESWEEVGGNGSIKVNVRTLSLVVRQTQDVQREIRCLLESLRSKLNLQAALHVEALTVPADFWSKVGEDFDDPEANGPPNPPAKEKSPQRRLARLTKKEAALLRSLSKVESAPKVTLFSGQELEIRFGGKSPLRLGLLPVVTTDRAALRVQAVAMKSTDHFDLSDIATVRLESGHSLLLDATELSSTVLGPEVPILDRLRNPALFLQPDPDMPDHRTLLLITGQVVIVEEDEKTP